MNYYGYCTQSVLEIPGIIECFSINPLNPNLIAAGLRSGQVHTYPPRCLDVDYTSA